MSSSDHAPASGGTASSETGPATPSRVPGGDDDAIDVARAFVEAVAWGEHHAVWELLGPEGRKTVLRVAVARGMDEGLSARVRDDTAARGERDSFLADLVNGLRADLQGSDLDNLQYEPDPASGIDGPDRARVMLVSPLIDPLALGDPLPVASVELVRHQGRWQVEGLKPRAQQ